MWLYLHSQPAAVNSPSVVFPRGALDLFKINQVCAVSAAGWAKARSAWPWHAAGSLGIMPSTRILDGSSLDPHCFLSPSPHPQTTQASGSVTSPFRTVEGYKQKRVPVLGELVFCLEFCLDSFIQGKICLVRLAFALRLALLGAVLLFPDWLLLLVLVLLVAGFGDGETGGGGWCSWGKLGRMQLPFRSLLFVCGVVLPRDWREQADLW